MDDTFACPECGTPVKIGGLAPGRQVRCGFCRRLLEVPYLPRVVKSRWRRRRFGRPWWFVWAWMAIGLAGAAVVAVSVAMGLFRWERARLERSIENLIAASERAESQGDLGKALVDLDAAIRLRTSADGDQAEPLAALRQRRQELNLREATAALEHLKSRGAAELPLGDWLNLLARVEADRDLANLAPAVRQAFGHSLQQRVTFLLASAQDALTSARPNAAQEACEAAWTLSPHLSPEPRSTLRSQLETILNQIVARHGILVEPLRGQAVEPRPPRQGEWSIPNLGRALTNKGYVPQPDASAWRELWASAPYRLVIELNETYDGTYMMSENRLTRIDARLLLLHQGKAIWETTPSARTRVPLPGLSAYLSGQLALSSKRSPEVERLLHEDARGSIHEKLAFALDHMPACGQTAR